MNLIHSLKAIMTHIERKQEEKDTWVAAWKEEGRVGGRRRRRKGLGGRHPCIVSLHAPVPAVIPALCLSQSTGDVWLLGTVARGWKLRVSGFSKPLLYSGLPFRKKKFLYSTHSTGVKLGLACHAQALLMANMMGG